MYIIYAIRQKKMVESNFLYILLENNKRQKPVYAYVFDARIRQRCHIFHIDRHVVIDKLIGYICPVKWPWRHGRKSTSSPKSW